MAYVADPTLVTLIGQLDFEIRRTASALQVV
jgi:hypothetical protein